MNRESSAGGQTPDAARFGRIYVNWEALTPPLSRRRERELEPPLVRRHL
jgi:hypothetical protein